MLLVSTKFADPWSQLPSPTSEVRSIASQVENTSGVPLPYPHARGLKPGELK